MNIILKVSFAAILALSLGTPLYADDEVDLALA